MTIKLYHCKRSRSLRPLWTLEEMGLDYELITMEFPPRLTYAGYLTINNLGTVPTLVEGDVTLTESTAMALYLAEKHGPTNLNAWPIGSRLWLVLKLAASKRCDAHIPANAGAAIYPARTRGAQESAGSRRLH